MSDSGSGNPTGISASHSEGALAITMLAIEHQPASFQSASDQADMKMLLDRLIENDVQLAHYTQSV